MHLARRRYVRKGNAAAELRLLTGSDSERSKLTWPLFSQLRQFYVVGRALPSESNENPELYRMRIFARDAVLARSRFWYQMKRQHKVRKIQGEIISTTEIFEKKTGNIKNYGIFLRYLTRADTVNMYKEYRDVSLCGAVSQMYMEMSGRHSAALDSIQIIRTSILDKSNVRRPQISQFTSEQIRFPKTNNLKRAPSKALGSRVRAVRPTLY